MHHTGRTHFSFKKAETRYHFFQGMIPAQFLFNLLLLLQEEWKGDLSKVRLTASSIALNFWCSKLISKMWLFSQIWDITCFAWHPGILAWEVVFISYMLLFINIEDDSSFLADFVKRSVDTKRVPWTLFLENSNMKWLGIENHTLFSMWTNKSVI